MPKWKCKKCGRQTSLTGERVENVQEKSDAGLLYLSGLALKVSAFWKSVAPSTLLPWIRRFTQDRAAKPQPTPGGVVVMEVDDVWPCVGNTKNKLWICLAFCRDTGQLVDWHCGDRGQATLDQLRVRLKHWKVRLYCTDCDVCYDQAWPVGKHDQGKSETWRLEQIHSRLRHGLARLTAFGVAWKARRRTRVVSRSIEMVNLTIALLPRFRINGSLNEIMSLAA